MSIVYECRHCRHVIGQLSQRNITELKSEFNELSLDDREKMIKYLENGDIHIQAICESCEKALGEHPEYHELDYFLQ